MGTGSFISPDGYILTAWHVLDACEKFIRKNRKYNLKIVIYHLSSNKSKLHFNIVPLDKKIKVSIKNIDENYAGPFQLDIGLAKVGIRSGRIPHMLIKKQNADLYEDIMLCSYPNPTESLIIFRRLHSYSGLGYSPILQFGRITAFMPEDCHINPYGLQTDIVGIGGSSGSPIVNRYYEIVGLAQQVITATTYNKRNQTNGTAKIGLIFGSTNSTLLQCYTSARDLIEKGGPKTVTLQVGGYTKFEKSRNK
jgi:hypothetical protein